MCGRYRLRRWDLAEAAAMGMLPKFEEFSEIKIRHNFGQFIPSNQVPIVRLETGQRVLDFAKWGFVPEWAQGESKAPKPINARSETVATSGMFRKAFKFSRCLLPADGFFEPKGPKTGKRREQFFFRRPDDGVFAFAGLRGGPTCLLLTTTPNADVAPIHDRMPLILRPEDYGKWLDPVTDVAELQELLKPAADGELILEAEDKPAPPHDRGLFG